MRLGKALEALEIVFPAGDSIPFKQLTFEIEGRGISSSSSKRSVKLHFALDFRPNAQATLRCSLVEAAGIADAGKLTTLFEISR